MLDLSNMIYVKRNIEKKLYEYLSLFPVVAITGPRQSGKSTLIKHALGKKYKYVTLDDYRVIDQLEDDPERFFSVHSENIIFDEVQKYPKIFNYIKRKVDEGRHVYGRYVLTGSSQFSLQQNISESLAGRIGLLQLLPFDFQETPSKYHSIINGSYPEQVLRNYSYNGDWYSSYMETYIQKDVRTVANIGDIHDFTRFIKLLAANISTQFNASYYSKILGISIPTVKRWISVLEISYIVYLLKPYYNNLGKRISKSPKIYFYDTGLASFLNGAMESKWESGPLAGAIFENYIVTECIKKSLHHGVRTEYFYFREHNGNEIDLIAEHRDEKEYIEIKHSMTFRPRMIKTLEKYMDENTKSYLIYQGESLDYSKNINVINYRKFLE